MIPMRRRFEAPLLNDEALALWPNWGVAVSFTTWQSHEKARFPVVRDGFEKIFNSCVDSGGRYSLETIPSTASLRIAADGRRLFVGITGNSLPAARSGRRGVSACGLTPDAERMRCLTIESEERETWTAEVLADRLLSRGQSIETL
jgi:hypothetical protein